MAPKQLSFQLYFCLPFGRWIDGLLVKGLLWAHILYLHVLLVQIAQAFNQNLFLSPRDIGKYVIYVLQL